ncbi:MAG: inorganic phosphate transporter, partial [Candidatus Latescibacterota bacterium]
AANSIATVVSTRVLSPRWAVIWAAFFNFIAFLIFETHVAATIGKGVVDPTSVTLPVVTAALVGAIAWNLITWYGGIPSSSSHALVGGLAGVAVAYKGWDALKWGGLHENGLLRIAAFIFIAPLLGMVIGWILMQLTYWLFRNATARRVGGLFRRLQLLSAAAYSLGHGGNDAQKTMGIIYAVLLAAGPLTHVTTSDPVPLWVVLACHAAMGLGTLSGGWRIVRTMGQRICMLQPVHGFSAETAGALCLYAATGLGIPVSTTHTITGGIVGVGSTRGIKAVKWGVAGRVVWAWILTIPASALIAVATYYLFTVVGWTGVEPMVAR